MSLRSLRYLPLSHKLLNFRVKSQFKQELLKKYLPINEETFRFLGQLNTDNIDIPGSMIKDYSVKFIPKSIGKNTSLQTLNIEPFNDDLQTDFIPNTISHCINLQRLDITVESPIQISPSLGMCINLISLNISTKGQKFPDIFTNLKQLTLLTLFNCGLSEIYDSICELSLLKSLNLEKNRITKIPQNLINLSKLENLFLSENKLTRLENLPSSVKEIFCYRNKISFLDIKNCLNLNIVDLNNNQLSDLDLNLPNLINSINLSFNKLKDLPKLNPNLSELIISENELKSLDLSGFNLTKLYAEENEIENISFSSSLFEIVIYGNKFKSLDLSGLTNLNQLRADDNEISSIISTTVLPNLREIDLNHNKLTSFDIPSNFLPVINVLVLDYNELTQIPKINALRFLYLTNNKIETISKIDKRWIIYTPNLDLIDLQGNPIAENQEYPILIMDKINSNEIKLVFS